MTHQEHSDLKERLRLQYIDITNYQERFLFWHDHQGNLQYVDSVKYSESYSQAKKKKEQNDIELRQEQLKKGKKGAVVDTSGLWIEVSKIKNLIEIEDETKGIQEPVLPTTDEEKAFVAKYWLDYQLSIRTISDASIYDFEVFKNDFESDLKDYLTDEDKKLFAEKKIEKITERITNQVQIWKVAHGVSDVYLCKGEPDKSDEKEEIEYFFEDCVKKMHNEQKVLLLLYKCSQINYQLYEYASFLIPFYQCKRFLESYIKQQENSKIEQNSNLVSISNQNSDVSILNTYIEIMAYTYFLGKIKVITEIDCFSKSQDAIRVYNSQIERLGNTGLDPLSKEKASTNNDYKDALLKPEPIKDEKVMKVVKKVKDLLLTKYPQRKDEIIQLLSPYLPYLVK